MKPRFYNIIEQCVTSGAETGYKRAFKHQDEPSINNIVHHIKDAVMLELAEYLSFDDEI